MGNGSSFSSLSVPYICGDDTGEFTQALIQAVSSSNKFIYKNSYANAILEVKIADLSDEHIGFQRDRLKDDGSFKKNLRPIEGRRFLKAEVSLISSKTSKALWGPHIIEMDTDYDYVDGDSLQDLSFIDTAGTRITVLSFSLGQLEEQQNAKSAALVPLFQILSQKIVDMLSIDCE